MRPPVSLPPGVRRSDALLAGALLVMSLAQVMWVQPVQILGRADSSWFGVVLAVVSVLPLAWRRVHACAAAVVGTSLWWVPTDAFLFVGYVCAVLLSYALGRWCRSRVRGLLACSWAMASGTMGMLAIGSDHGSPEPLLFDLDIRRWVARQDLPGADVLLGIVGLWLIVLGSWAVGRHLSNQDLVAAERLASEREAVRRSAVEEERARIVRELHDVVGHEVTLMSIQSEAAAQALARDPDRASGPIAAVRETAHRASRELRAMLDLLGDGELPVVPDGRGLAELADRAARLGIPNNLRVIGEPWSDAPRHWFAVNRIVQESLTNAGKHARGEEVEVLVEWSCDGVRVAVANACREAQPAGDGYGVPGMAERARLLGGTLTAARVDGRFEVRAWLPALTGTGP